MRGKEGSEGKGRGKRGKEEEGEEEGRRGLLLHVHKGGVFVRVPKPCMHFLQVQPPLFPPYSPLLYLAERRWELADGKILRFLFVFLGGELAGKDGDEGEREDDDDSGKELLEREDAEEGAVGEDERDHHSVENHRPGKSSRMKSLWGYIHILERS